MADSTLIRTVLVVDDEPDHLRLVRVGFNRLGGWTLREASTLAEARAALARELPDVVVVDYELPDGTGLELARALTAMIPSPGVVLMTGHGSEDLAAEALAAAIDAYLPKHGNFLGSLGVAVERASREAAARREQLLVAERATRLRALMYASGAVVRESDPDAVLSAIADQVQETVVCDSIAVYLPSVGGGFRPCLWRSPTGLREQDITVPLETMGLVAQGGSSLQMTTAGDEQFPMPDESPPRSLLLVPFTMGYQGTGILVLTRRGRPFTDIDREMLEIFGNHVAAALAAATLRAADMRRAEHLATIGRATAAVAAATSLTQALNRLTQGAVEVTVAAAGQVQLYTDDNSYVVCHAAVINGQNIDTVPFQRQAVTADTIAGRVLGDGLPVLENDFVSGAAATALGLLLETSASALAVSVRSRDRLLGLVLVESSEPNGFSLEHLEALVILSDQVVGALETTALLDRVTHSESLMRAVLRAVPEAMLVTEPDGTLVFWNDAAADLFGQPFISSLPSNLDRLFGRSQPFDLSLGVETETDFYPLTGDPIPVAVTRTAIPQVNERVGGDVYVLRDLR